MHGGQLIASCLLQVEGARVLLERQVETAVCPVHAPEAHIRSSQTAPIADLLEARGRVRYRPERLVVAPEHELLVAPLMQQAALGGALVGRGSNKGQRLVAEAVLFGTGLDGICQVLVDVDEQLRIAEHACQVERAAQWRLGFALESAGDEGEADLVERLRFAERHAEAAEDADRFVQLLPRRVVPEGKAVGEREAAQRLRPFEHAAVGRRPIEYLLQQLQTKSGIAHDVGRGGLGQLVVEHGT